MPKEIKRFIGDDGELLVPVPVPAPAPESRVQALKRMLSGSTESGTSKKKVPSSQEYDTSTMTPRGSQDSMPSFSYPECANFANSVPLGRKGKDFYVYTVPQYENAQIMTAHPAVIVNNGGWYWLCPNPYCPDFSTYARLLPFQQNGQGVLLSTDSVFVYSIQEFMDERILPSHKNKPLVLVEDRQQNMLLFRTPGISTPSSAYRR